MEGWDGGWPSKPPIDSSSLTEEEKRETETNAFQFQSEMVELDKFFAEQPPIEADAMVSLREYDVENDQPGVRTFMVTSGESLVPNRMSLDRDGRLVCVFDYPDGVIGEDDKYPQVVASIGDTQDLAPELYKLMDDKVDYPSLKSFVDRNFILIGGRKPVINTLKEAIRVRATENAKEEFERKEAERLNTYDQDEMSGMF